MNPTHAYYPRRLLWYAMLGFSLYWFSNVLVTFPWLLSKTLGIIAMFLSTFLWGYMTYYGLRHAPKRDWSKDTLSMALCFLITALVQDYLLFVVYRGVPEELYELTTFLAYGFVFLIPFFVRFVIRKRSPSYTLSISNRKIILTLSIGIVSLIITLWSVKYW